MASQGYTYTVDGKTYTLPPEEFERKRRLFAQANNLEDEVFADSRAASTSTQTTPAEEDREPRKKLLKPKEEPDKEKSEDEEQPKDEPRKSNLVEPKRKFGSRERGAERYIETPWQGTKRLLRPLRKPAEKIAQGVEWAAEKTEELKNKALEKGLEYSAKKHGLSEEEAKATAQKLTEAADIPISKHLANKGIVESVEEATRGLGMHKEKKDKSKLRALGRDVMQGTAGTVRGIADVAEGFTTPRMLAELGIATAFPPYSLTFLPGLIAGTGPAAKEMTEGVMERDVAKATRGAGAIGTSGTFATMIGSHTFGKHKPDKSFRKKIQRQAKEQAEEALGENLVQTIEGGGEGPEPPESPALVPYQPVGKELRVRPQEPVRPVSKKKLVKTPAEEAVKITPQKQTLLMEKEPAGQLAEIREAAEANRAANVAYPRANEVTRLQFEILNRLAERKEHGITPDQAENYSINPVGSNVMREIVTRMDKGDMDFARASRLLRMDVADRIPVEGKDLVLKEKKLPYVDIKAPRPSPPTNVVTNPMDYRLPQKTQIKELRRLSTENEPQIVEFNSEMYEKYDAPFSHRVKTEDSIYRKANNLEKIADRPWYNAYSIHDGVGSRFSFKRLDQVGQILGEMQDRGWEIIKVDDKLNTPSESGWCDISAEVKMPNGQVVEFQFVPKEVVEASKVTHEFHEKWDKATDDYRRQNKREYGDALLENQERLLDARAAYLRRAGMDEAALAASVKSTLASSVGRRLLPRETHSSSKSLGRGGVISSQEPLRLTTQKSGPSTRIAPENLLRQTSQEPSAITTPPSMPNVAELANIGKSEIKGVTLLRNPGREFNVEKPGGKLELVRPKPDEQLAISPTRTAGGKTIYELHDGFTHDITRRSALGLVKNLGEVSPGEASGGAGVRSLGSAGRGVPDDTFISRVWERMREEYPESITGEEPRVHHTRLRAKMDEAMELVRTNPDAALERALDPEAGVDGVAASVVMAEQARLSGNNQLFEFLTKNRSLEQTRRGVAISAENINYLINTDAVFQQQLLRMQLERLGRRSFRRAGRGEGGRRATGIERIERETERFIEGTRGRSGAEVERQIDRTFGKEARENPIYGRIIQQLRDLDERGRLTPQFEQEFRAFVQDNVMSRRGVRLTKDQTKRISQLSERIRTAQEKLGNENVGNPDYEAENIAFFKARREMSDYLAAQVPASKLRIATGTLFRGIMLMSIKSPILNIGSNIEVGLMEAISRRLANARVNGADRTLAKRYADMVRKIYRKTGTDLSRMSRLDDEGYSGERVLGEGSTIHAQGPGVFRKGARAVENLVFKWMMGYPDVQFSATAFADSVNINAMRMAKGNKASAQALMKDSMLVYPKTPEGQMLRYQGIMDAMVATWTNPSHASRFSEGVRKLFNVGDIRAGDIIFPFVKTPANVVETGMDYAGLGAVKGTYNIMKMIATGDASKTQVQSTIRGYVRAGLGFMLALGITSQLQDDDFVGAYDPRTAQNQKVRNSRPNSFRINGKWINADWFGPIGVPMVAIMYARQMQRDKEKYFSRAIYYGKGVASNLYRLPGIEEVHGYLARTAHRRDLTPEQLGAELSATLIDEAAARLIPAIISDVAAAADDYRRRSRVLDKPVATAIKGVQKKIPLLREKLPVETNIYGEAIPTEGPLSQIGFGMRVTKDESDAITNEIDRLAVVTGKNINFTDWDKTPSEKLGVLRNAVGEEEYQRLKVIYGKTLQKALSEMIQNPMYKNLDAGYKVVEMQAVDNAVIDWIVGQAAQQYGAR